MLYEVIGKRINPNEFQESDTSESGQEEEEYTQEHTIIMQTYEDQDVDDRESSYSIILKQIHGDDNNTIRNSINDDEACIELLKGSIDQTK